MNINLNISDTIALLALLCSTAGIFLTLLSLREMQKQRLLSVKPKLILKFAHDEYNYSEDPSCSGKYNHLDFALRNIGTGGAWKIEIISKLNPVFIPEKMIISNCDNTFITVVIDEHTIEGFRLDVDDDTTYDVMAPGESTQFSFIEIPGLIYTVIATLLRDKEFDMLYNLEGKDVFNAYIRYSDILEKRHCDTYSVRINSIAVDEDKKTASISYVMVPQKNKIKSLFVRKATRDQSFKYICGILDNFSASQEKS